MNPVRAIRRRLNESDEYIIIIVSTFGLALSGALLLEFVIKLAKKRVTG
ncbi:hypothetical protein HYX70_02230 [Candidatus Saccharibacteria bacterium]|nr:hypothetical protein [Candidatus Saccharibacteria bacterium]